MIYTDRKDITETDCISLLENTKILILEIDTQKAIGPIDFENFVYEKMCIAAQKTKFEGSIKQTGKLDFPDILAKGYFGVEVKMTTTDHWISLGNSIFESSRVKDVERIFIFFGKFGGDFDVKFRPYQDCLASIKVTHSPRYVIDMNLLKKENILKKMNIDYDVFRKEENMVNRVKDFYKKQLKNGEELWWIDEEQKQSGISPIIRSFNHLNSEEKNEFIIDSMILFPEIFGGNILKFERVAAYLMTEYGAVSSNLRDIFTAGGRESIDIENKPSEVSKILFHVHKQAKRIKKKIEEIDEQKLLHYWRTEKLSSSRISQWKSMLPVQSTENKDISVFQVFESGL